MGEGERERWTTLGQTELLLCPAAVRVSDMDIEGGRRPLIAATISRFEGGEEKDDEREKGNIKCRMDRRV